MTSNKVSLSIVDRHHVSIDRSQTDLWQKKVCMVNFACNGHKRQTAGRRTHSIPPPDLVVGTWGSTTRAGGW